MTDWRNLPIDIMTAPKRDSKVWQKDTLTWEDLLEKLSRPGSKKESGNYVLGTFSGTRRQKSAITTRTGLYLDADYASSDFLDRVKKALGGTAYAYHSTWRSTPESPRWRLIIFLDRAVLPDEYLYLAERLMDEIGRDDFDPGSSQPERYMFWPSAQVKKDYVFGSEDGNRLAVDPMLEDFVDDLGDRPTPKPHVNKRNPFEIDGVVGAFNRAYDIEEAIEAFELPYESDGDRRWHLVGARAVAGLSEIEDGLVFSHHATDPAFGKASSAFDLVRLHKFGDLDEDAAPKTPVNRMPSHLAMCDFASTDARVIKELVGGDFADDMNDIIDEEEDRNWITRLSISPKDGSVKDIMPNWDLIVKHEECFRNLRYNELTFSIETSGDLPWRTLEPGKEVFTEADTAEMNHYLERKFKIRPPRGIVDELILATAYRRRFSPVRDYLDALPTWDGVPRVETCLPGVVPTAYTRMVARKGLVAAVARVYDPGCKWDHVVTLRGPENLGKTFWTEKVFGGFTAPLGDLRNKDTLLVAHRAWCVFADEGHSLRKSDSDMQKEFLTRREDVFRPPYERTTQAYKRRFVIWSTTNDHTFLRNEEGNRRHLPVECVSKVNFEQLTDEYITQLWAEAKHLYLAGETLWLSDEQSEVANAVKGSYTEEDALSGIVQEYLDTYVPEDWEDMSPERRTQWLVDNADGMVPSGNHQVDYVCSTQIWVEALGRRIGDHRRVDLLSITSVLKGLPQEWEPVGQRRFRHYGPQLAFRRITKGLEDVL